MATFVALTACIHTTHALNEKKVFSQIALSLATMCAVLLMADLLIQWTVVLPSTQSGETIGLSLFTQYNPHGIFVSLESLGYLMMSTAFLFLAPSSTKENYNNPSDGHSSQASFWQSALLRVFS
jgi:hypothetical protein